MEAFLGNARPASAGAPGAGLAEARRATTLTRLGADSTTWKVAAIGGAVVAWAVASLLFEPLRLVAHAPRPQVAVEASSALFRLFGALVLFLFAQGESLRLRWVATGLMVMGIGALGFGNLWPMLVGAPDANALMYSALVVWIISGALFVVGLLPRSAPELSLRVLLLLLAGFAALGFAVPIAADHRLLPPLVGIDNLDTAPADMPLPGLTVWYWILSLVPLGLAVAAAAGAVWRGWGHAWRGWLAAALVLFAGTQLHNALWPSVYSAVLTSAGVLRLGMGAVIAVGGVLELRRLATERAALLAVAQERAAALGDLETLRADFTRMVAHELGSPIAAIRAWADVLATGALGLEQQPRALATIRGETDKLQGLVADVRAIATIERDDFVVRCRPVPVAELLAEAAAHNRSLPGDHPLLTAIVAHEDVLADPERIGQVLRNLLGNAAKYAPDGTPIELRAVRRDGRIRVEVVDHGLGIAPEDKERIFEKYGRGRLPDGRRVSGAGIGLYLARRIVQAHGGDLTVVPTPGGGATFGFDLEIVR